MNHSIGGVIAKVVQDRLKEADSSLGGLTDYHLKWIKGYVYYKFNTKVVDFHIDFNSSPRRLVVIPSMDSGKIINRVAWLRFLWSIWRDKNPKKPLLHPCFWPQALEIPEWKIEFRRKKL